MLFIVFYVFIRLMYGASWRFCFGLERSISVERKAFGLDWSKVFQLNNTPHSANACGLLYAIVVRGPTTAHNIALAQWGANHMAQVVRFFSPPPPSLRSGEGARTFTVGFDLI